MHDWTQLVIDILGLIASAIGFWISLIVYRYLKRQDDLVGDVAGHGRQIRETRMAVSRVEGYLGIDPFNYNDD